MTKKQFISIMTKNGILVCAGKANSWLGSLQHAQSWNNGGIGKRVSYAIFDNGYMAWIEPTRSYDNWIDAVDDYETRNWIKLNK